MDQVLRPHLVYMAAYLEDIAVNSADWNTHLARLEAVLNALGEAGLRANPNECYGLVLEEASYLEYTIGWGNVKPQATKVDAIVNWPGPLTKKQVRTFLGLVGYHCLFMPHFASIATPYHELTAKSCTM